MKEKYVSKDRGVIMLYGMVIGIFIGVLIGITIMALLSYTD